MNKLLLVAALAAIATPLPAAAKPAPMAQANAEVRMDHISIVTLGSAKAKGAPVVLVPGLASPRAVWDGVATELAKTHRVYLVQVNGFGGDDPGANLRPGLLDGIIADLSAALARDHARPVRYVGHSMGGLVGMIFAKAHPAQVERLMVVDSLPDFAVLLAQGGPMPTVAQIETAASMMRTATAARHGKPMTSEAVAAGVDSLALTEGARVKMRGWATAADARVAGQAVYEDITTDFRPSLPSITMPMTVVVPWTASSFGKDRTLAFYAIQYRGAPTVTFVPIAEAGHFVMLDQPAAFRAALDVFLKR
ncbi:alpha/beta hydrolase [Sphingomonas sp.]|uniref:alpha/beta fold hydrolase n=1 Tax=Sphingomonas sp. TaxID=28214 RepID=UPI00286A0A82|nr:alpha/beta hydrolase [Sphingomonas sp.]